MKVVKIVIGIAAGIYAVGGMIQLVWNVLSSDAGSLYGLTNITAAVVPPCLGAALALWLLRSAFARPKPQRRDGGAPAPPNPDARP